MSTISTRPQQESGLAPSSVPYDATITCVDITRSFGGLFALNEVSAIFKHSEITALIGPNGAGKTTLFHVIAGAIRPHGGSIIFRNRSISAWPIWKVARFGIGRLFQDVRVFDRLTVLENVLVAFPAGSKHGVARALECLGLIRRGQSQRSQAAKQLLEFAGLLDSQDALGGALSFGQQKLLALTRLLASGATALLLDEPTAGLHPEMTERLLHMLKALASMGSSVVLVEHAIPTVESAIDSVVVLDAGRVVACGSYQEISGDDYLREAYLGL